MCYVCVRFYMFTQVLCFDFFVFLYVKFLLNTSSVVTVSNMSGHVGLLLKWLFQP